MVQNHAVGRRRIQLRLGTAGEPQKARVALSQQRVTNRISFFILSRQGFNQILWGMGQNKTLSWCDTVFSNQLIY